MIRIHGIPSKRQLTNVTLERSNYFPDHLSIFCKKHPNEPQNILTDIKSNLKTITLK